MQHMLIKNDDALKVLDNLIEKQVKFDAIITDPPYGTTNAKWDVKINWTEIIDKFYKILNPNGKIIMFGDYKSSMLMNHKTFKYKLYWTKQRGSDFLNAKVKPLNSVEEILVYYKKRGTYNPQMVAGEPYTMIRKNNSNNLYNDYKPYDTINKGERYPTTQISIPNTGKKHPSEKPVELMEWLIKSFTNKHDTILDPFMGSGSTGVACFNLHRDFVGVELDEKYFAIAKDRLEKKRSGDE